MGFSYHEGELEVQRRSGVLSRAARMAAGVHDALPPVAVDFLTEVDLVVIGSIDDRGRPWATPLSDRVGWGSALDSRTLRLEVIPGVGDPLVDQLRPGRPIALIGLDLATRRRMRVNGTVTAASGHSIDLVVEEAYGNCPKYIQRRTRGPSLQLDAVPPVTADALNERQRQCISDADTFFIATTDGGGRADVSHRGGLPGFVMVEGPDRLVWRDYQGNSMFNTLGNVVRSDRAGLLFIDFQAGRALHLTGRAEVRWSPPADGDGAAKVQAVEFTVDGVVDRPGALRHSWPLVEYSPFNPPLPREDRPQASRKPS